VFYEWHCIVLHWLYCIDLFSCIAASLFDKLTYFRFYSAASRSIAVMCTRPSGPRPTHWDRGMLRCLEVALRPRPPHRCSQHGDWEGPIPPNFWSLGTTSMLVLTDFTDQVALQLLQCAHVSLISLFKMIIKNSRWLSQRVDFGGQFYLKWSHISLPQWLVFS